MRAADYVTGCVEVRQLRSVYKLSFADIVRVNRFKSAAAPAVPEIAAASDEESSTASGSEAKAKARKEASAARLHVFLTKKKAKTRMADLEETAFLLRLDVGTDGCICSGKSLGNFDQVYPPHSSNSEMCMMTHIRRTVVARSRVLYYLLL